MTEAALRYRISPGGSWRVALPGIYLAHDGLLTVAQRELAAVLYTGRGCVITGRAALTRFGLRVPLAEAIDVLIPEETRRQSVEFVRVHRTTRMPARPWRIDGLCWAPPPQAVADAARFETDFRQVRALVADAVQRGKVTVAQLVAELQAGPKHGSAALRTTLEEVADGIRSAAEGDLRILIKRSGLPAPMYNADLYTEAGEFITQADAWWGDAGVAGEVESRAWHLSPADWEKTLAKRARMAAHGIIVVQATPRQLRSEGQRVISQLRSAREAGLRRPPLPIRALARPTGRIVVPKVPS